MKTHSNKGSPKSENHPAHSAPRRKWPRRFATLLLVLLVGVYFLWVKPFWGFPFNNSRHTRVPITPPWALECWLWEDDTNTADAVHELLEGYSKHDIPVRTVLIDSPWSKRYNDFTVDESRYPQPARFFNDLQTRGYRVVLWMTPMVNSRNRDTPIQDAKEFHNEALLHGYLAGNGHEVRWWKGKGSFIDYTNPQALEWWHGLQNDVLTWGVDGWKLDGTDTLFSGPGFIPYQKTHAGWMSTREYMDLYNREEYRHGLSRNPEFIVMTRAIDNRYFPASHPEGFAPFDAAPVTWVGDRTHEWSSKTAIDTGELDAMKQSESILDRGFEGALRDILASADKGYCVVGDDIAGYHGREPIPPRLYIRWAQFATFTGLFLNGGHGERRLWKRSPEELEIIRRFSWLHTELVPYMYSHVVLCHEGGRPLIRPAHGNYSYHFGDDLFVAPIYKDSLTNQIHLPAGNWKSLFHPNRPYNGPAIVEERFELNDFPVFIREGAIIPMNVSRPYTGFGDRSSDGFLTWLIYPGGTNEFTVHHPDLSGTTRIRTEQSQDSKRLILTLDGIQKPHRFRILLDESPITVKREDQSLVEGSDWSFDRPTHTLRIEGTRLPSKRYIIE